MSTPTTMTFPLNARYKVRSDGTILGTRGLPLRPQTNGKYGYLSVQFGRSLRMYVHRAVALTFLGDSGGLEVDHIDGDTSNNDIGNLRYLSHAQNLAAQRERVLQCKRGHWFAGNEMWRSEGRRTCRKCSQERERNRPSRAKRQVAA